MTGNVATTTPSITTWVRNLDRSQRDDNAQVRGTVKHLHIRTGFEKFTEGVARLFGKKEPNHLEGMKQRVYQAIKNDFGAQIADKVFTPLEHAKNLTAGDLRSMLYAAKLEQALSSQTPLTDKLPRTPNAKLGDVFKQWANEKTDQQHEGDQASQVRNMAKAFAFVEIGEINEYNNCSLKADAPPTDADTGDGLKDIATNLKKEREREQAALRRDELAVKYLDTPALSLAQTLTNIASSFNDSIVIFGQPSGSGSKTNSQLVADNMKKLAAQDNPDPAVKHFTTKQLQPDAITIMGVQIGPRLSLFNTQLSKAIDSMVNAKENLATAEKADPLIQENVDAAKEGVRKAEGELNGASREILKVLGEARENFVATASLLQNPAVMNGLDPNAVSVMRTMGQEYGRLAVEFGNPDGPVQGLMAMAMLACAEPETAQQIWKGA